MSESPKNPFRGLVSFERNEPLFGRDRDVVLFRDRVQTGRTTLLFAGSGVGKTSFLEAKAIPDLEAAGYWVCQYRSWATAEPFAALETHVENSLRELGAPLLARVQALLGGDLSEPDRATLLAAQRRLEAPSPTLYEKFVNWLGPACEDLPLGGTKSDDLDLPVGMVLVLDQFEEIFQYHVYRPYFAPFLDQLCKLVNDRSLEIAVVLSLREEYLGELSVFDNRIPDPFGNYYRLRCPSLQEAERIVESTCEEAKVLPAPDGLKALIRELATIEIGAGAANSTSSKSDGNKADPVVRNFVPPPYLQLVCRALWDKSDFAVLAAPAAGHGERANAPRRPMFLANYQKGDATKVLETYCRDKLNPLPLWQKRLAARAFDYLVTQNGAKMAYEISQLAKHMFVPRRLLEITLERLSAPETRILRRTSTPGGSPWFELYHDMYARIVRRWKLEFNSSFEIGRFAAIFVTIVFIVAIGDEAKEKRIREEREAASNARDAKTLQEADLDIPTLFLKAQEAHASLKERKAPSAEGLWGEAWARRAALAEAYGETSEALLYWLKALSVDRASAAGARYRRSAYRSAEPYRDLLATYRHPGIEGMIATINGGPLASGAPGFVTWSGRDVRLWSLGSATNPSAVEVPVKTWTIPPSPVRFNAAQSNEENSARRKGLAIEHAYVHPKVSLVVTGYDGNGAFAWISNPEARSESASPSPSPGDPLGTLPLSVVKNEEQFISLVPPKVSSDAFIQTQLTGDEAAPFLVTVSEKSVLSLFRRTLDPDRPSGRPEKKAAPRNDEAWSKVGTVPLGLDDSYYISADGRRVVLSRGGEGPDAGVIKSFTCQTSKPIDPMKVACVPDSGIPLEHKSSDSRIVLGASGEALALVGSPYHPPTKIRVYDWLGKRESWSVDVGLVRPLNALELSPKADRFIVNFPSGASIWTADQKFARRWGVTATFDTTGHQLLAVERGQGVRAWSAEATETKPVAWDRNGRLSSDGDVWVEPKAADNKIVVMNASDRAPRRELDVAGFWPRRGVVPAINVRASLGANVIAANLGFLSSFGDRIVVWDQRSDLPPWQLSEGDDPLLGNVAALERTGKYLVTHQRGLLSLWDVAGKRKIGPKGEAWRGGGRVEFSADGSLVAVLRTDGTLGVRSTDDGTEFTAFEPVRDASDLELGPGVALVTTPKGVFLWRRSTDPSLTELPRTPAEVTVTALHPSANEAVFVTRDGHLYLWSLDPIAKLQALRIDSATPQRVVFTEDGKNVLLVAGSRLHRISISRDASNNVKLTFEGTRILHGSVTEIVPLDPAGKEVRVDSNAENCRTINTISFEDREVDPGLHVRAPGEDTPDNLLKEWSRLLGLTLDDRGVVTPSAK